MSGPPSPVEAQPAKRSLFKKAPKWAARTAITKAASPETSTTNLFDRSGNFDNVAAEIERKRREKNAKTARDEKRRSSDSFEVGDTARRASGSKKRRISDLHDDSSICSDHGSNGEEVPAMVNREDPISQRYNEVPVATKPKAQPQPQPRSIRNQAVVVEIESDADEDSDGDFPLPTQPSANSPTSFGVQASPGATRLPEPDSESDPELAELKRKARQKRRLAEKEEEERARAQTSYGHDVSNRYPSPAFDPVIQILVTSPIPSTAPLIVSRRMSQRLKEVKEAWLGRQTFPSDFSTSDVFFTYRLSKVYDVTTCKSLGIKVGSDGRLVPDVQSWANDDETGIGGEHEGKVHLEAMTEELHHKMRAAKRNERHGSSFVNKPTIERSETEATPMEGGERGGDNEALIRITLIAKGFKDAKLKVKSSTAFSKITNAARQLFGKQKPIPADQVLTLVFDGEPLEPPDGLIRDTDIEDKDTVEVHFR